MQPTSVRFAQAVRVLALAARRHGLTVPGFRSPPRLPGVHRSVRRHGEGAATIAVVLQGRPWPAVLADLVEGVVVANGLTGPEAMRCRTSLWEALGTAQESAA